MDEQAATPAAWALVALCLSVHIITGLLAAQAERGLLVDTLILGRGDEARRWVGGQTQQAIADGELWRLFTSVFLHVDGLHLVVNMLGLVVLGRVLEPWYGSFKLAAVFVLGGVMGSVVTHLVGQGMSDGASGGLFALLGLVCCVGWMSDVPKDDQRTFWVVLPVALLFNLVLSVWIPALDGWAHLGGLLVGVASAALWLVSANSRRGR